MKNKILFKRIVGLAILLYTLNIPIYSFNELSCSYSRAIGDISAPINSYINPSSLSFSKERSFEICYDNNFLLKELSTITLCYNNPTDYVDFSMLINRFGYQHFNVTNGAISVSKLLTENFSLGLRFNYYAIDYIDKEHISSVLSADIGFQYIIVDKLIIGMLITNPFFVKYNADEMNFYLPVIFEIGMNYIINDFFNALAEIEKNYRVPFAFKIGVEFLPYKELTLRAGLVTSPLMPTFGIEYMIAGFKTNISCQYHDILGFSPSVSLSYSF